MPCFVGAYLADKRVGNYKMQVICQVLWLFGQGLLLVMTLSFIDGALGGVEDTAVRFFITISLMIVALATGLIGPLCSVFVAGLLIGYS